MTRDPLARIRRDLKLVTWMMAVTIVLLIAILVIL